MRIFSCDTAVGLGMPRPEGPNRGNRQAVDLLPRSGRARPRDRAGDDPGVQNAVSNPDPGSAAGPHDAVTSFQRPPPAALAEYMATSAWLTSAVIPGGPSGSSAVSSPTTTMPIETPIRSSSPSSSMG